MSQEIKPGVKSSEFLLTVAALVLGTVLEVLALMQDTHEWAKVAGVVVGGLVQLLAALGYNAGRVRVKQAAIGAQAMHDGAIKDAASALMAAVRTEIRPQKPAQP